MGFKGKKPGGLISLIGGILNPILIICVVYNPALWFTSSFYVLSNHFIFMFFTIYGFGLWGIAFFLLLIGGIVSFIDSRKNIKHIRDAEQNM